MSRRILTPSTLLPVPNLPSRPLDGLSLSRNSVLIRLLVAAGLYLLAMLPPSETCAQEMCAQGGPPVIFSVTGGINRKGCVLCSPQTLVSINQSKATGEFVLDRTYPTGYASYVLYADAHMKLHATPGSIVGTASTLVTHRSEYISWNSWSINPRVTVYVRGGPGTPYYILRHHVGVKLSITGEIETGSVNGIGYTTTPSTPPVDLVLPPQVFTGFTSGSVDSFPEYPGVHYTRARFFDLNNGSQFVRSGPGATGKVADFKSHVDFECSAYINRGEAPNVSVQGPDKVMVDNEIAFSATATDDQATSFLTYAWAIEGGEIVGSADGATCQAKWSEPGNYRVTCEVTDCDGRKGTGGLTVVVSEAPSCTGNVYYDPPSTTIKETPRSYEIVPVVRMHGTFATVSGENACGCCEFRHYVRDLSLDAIPATDIVIVPATFLLLWHEDVGFSRCKGGIAHYGHRDELPNCPGDQYFDERSSGCSYFGSDTPDRTFGKRVPFNFHVEFKCAVKKIPRDGCEEDSEETMGRTTVKVVGDGKGFPIVHDAPPIETAAGSRHGQSEDEDALPPEYQDLLWGTHTIDGGAGSVLRFLVTEKSGYVAVAVFAEHSSPADSLTLLLEAQETSLTVAGLRPYKKTAPKSKAIISVEPNGWRRVFVFEHGGDLPSDLSISLTSLGLNHSFVLPRESSSGRESRETGRPASVSYRNAPAETKLSVLPSGKISFYLPEPGHCKVNVYDVTGRLVKELANAEWSAGEHILSWDRTDRENRRVSGGIFFVKLEARDQVATARLIVL